MKIGEVIDCRDLIGNPFNQTPHNTSRCCRLELIGGSHRKFYIVRIDDTRDPMYHTSENWTVVAEYGRIGTQGQSVVKGTFSYLVNAGISANRIVSEKIATGYLIVYKLGF